MFQKHQEIVSCMELFLSKVSEENLDFEYLETLYQKCHRDITELHASSKSPVVMSSLDSLMGTLNFHQNLLKRCKKLDYQNHLFMTDDRMTQSDDEKGLDTICGAEEAKMYLREACITPIQFPHLFKGKIKPWSRILLYGPPGTGKTSLARGVSEEIQCEFLSVSSADLLSSWIGESERHVKELFEKAKDLPGKCVIFIDEIDSLCRQRSQTEDECSRRVKTELLCQLDGVSGEKVMVLAATNCPWDLDNAFLRRFERRIFVDVPDGYVHWNTCMKSSSFGGIIKSTTGIMEAKHVTRSISSKLLAGTLSDYTPSDLPSWRQVIRYLYYIEKNSRGRKPNFKYKKLFCEKVSQIWTLSNLCFN